MGAQLPGAVSRSDEYMLGVCQRLDATNELLSKILDRLPAPVELTVSGQPGEIALREPAMAAPDEAAAIAEPDAASAARKAPAKKTPARPAAKKGTSNG